MTDLQRFPIVGCCIRLLHGRQLPMEYSTKRRRSVLQAFSDQGKLDFLIANPVQAVLIPYGNSQRVTIYDGHHRTRYYTETKFTRTETPPYIPTVLLSIGFLSSFLNVSPEHLVGEYNQQIESQMEGFSRRGAPIHSDNLPGSYTYESLIQAIMLSQISGFQLLAINALAT